MADERWRPEDRFVLLGEDTWRIVAAWSGDPSRHFIEDYAYVTDWKVENLRTGEVCMATAEFLNDTENVERVPKAQG